MSAGRFEMHQNQTRQRLPTTSVEHFEFFIIKRPEERMRWSCGPGQAALPGGFHIGAGVPGEGVPSPKLDF